MAFNKLTIEDVDIAGKRVLIRVDFNAPLDGEGNITDDRKITVHLPTINYALSHNAKIILMSHLGRPKGKMTSKLSLQRVAIRLSELLKHKVGFASDCIGEDVQKLVKSMNSGEVILLENLRFHPEEEANDANFAKELASLGEVYVDDAFSAVHRAHASISAITQYFPQAVSGFLLKEELEYLSQVFLHPERPICIVLGGAKVSSKIGIIDNLLDKIDKLIIGGGLAYTFLAAEGKNVGNSLLERDKIEDVNRILLDAKKYNVEVILPIDYLIADAFEQEAKTQIVTDNIPDGWIGVGIGPETVTRFTDALKGAKTIFWNGAVSVFEFEKFSAPTYALAKAIANENALTIAGGGETTAVIDRLGLEEKFSHVSTGGGACLEFLEGKELPGVSGLTNKGKE
ncbi:MAG: phosphoglycerate kinase [bacterium]|nr:phosphoglycerate kinase [bacterium]